MKIYIFQVYGQLQAQLLKRNFHYPFFNNFRISFSKKGKKTFLTLSHIGFEPITFRSRSHGEVTPGGDLTTG